MEYKHVVGMPDDICDNVAQCHEPAAYVWEDGAKLCVDCHIDRKQLECSHETYHSLRVCDECGKRTNAARDGRDE